jgi:JmjC domain, hydroxylase
VYLGPKGTSTILHADVLRSFSWSTNLCGRKKWFLVPPESTYLLYDCFGTHLARHLHVDVEDGTDTFFPGLARARQNAIEIVQEAGETIFVPSNWFHTVENLEATLSVNHNWLNGANIRSCWRHVESEVRSLRQRRGGTNAAAESIGDVDVVATNTDNSQVDDDILLLWHVVAKKAKSILDNCRQESVTATGKADLEGILIVLDGLLALVDEGATSVLTTRSECNVAELRAAVVSLL